MPPHLGENGLRSLDDVNILLKWDCPANGDGDHQVILPKVELLVSGLD